MATLDNLVVNVVPVGNVGSGEDNLQVFTVPANTLSQDKYGLRVRIHGSFAANTNDKRIRLYAGASVLIDSEAVPVSGGMWEAMIDLFRIDSSNQLAFARVLFSGASENYPSFGSYTALTLDETATIAIDATGEATSNNDIVSRLMQVDLVEAGS